MPITLEEVYRLAKPFIVLEDESQSAGYLIPDLSYLGSKKSDKDGAVSRVVRGDKSLTKRDFANEVSAAFQFPESFLGGSWDAFSEYINSLDWLPPTDSYLILITNADQLLSNESFEDFATLISVFEEAARNWESGVNHDNLVRAYQEEVVPKKSKFAIVFQLNPGSGLANHFGYWLRKNDIPKLPFAPRPHKLQ